MLPSSAGAARTLSGAPSAQTPGTAILPRGLPASDLQFPLPAASFIWTRWSIMGLSSVKNADVAASRTVRFGATLLVLLGAAAGELACSRAGADPPSGAAGMLIELN